MGQRRTGERGGRSVELSGVVSVEYDCLKKKPSIVFIRSWLCLKYHRDFGDSKTEGSGRFQEDFQEGFLFPYAPGRFRKVSGSGAGRGFA